MQTTLLGLAIALILALVTALVGPLLVDWSSHRARFEVEASRLIGTPVSVAGPIEVRLLPTPSLLLHDIETGPRWADSKLRARALRVEFGLGPLIRGAWRADELHLDAPEVTVGLDAAGQVEPPPLAIGFDPDQLSVDRLLIENGRLTVLDAASGRTIAFDQLSFAGDLRSLYGPFKGEGAFVAAGQTYRYRLAAGRRGEDGAMKLRLAFDSSSRPLALESEGVLSLSSAAPRFEGSFILSRPAGLVLPDGKTLVSVPWRATGRIKATPSAALLEQLELQYGPDERAIKLAGTADLRLGDQPRFTGMLSARQIDVDRALASADAPRRPPAATLQALAETLAETVQPPLPVQLGISIDSLVFGGAPLQTMRGDLRIEGDTVNLDDVEFRAPGVTQVHLSGQLTTAGKGLEFVGPVNVESTDSRALLAWLEGRADTARLASAGLQARGDVTIGRERVAVERLRATFERRQLEGRLAYVYAAGDRPPRLDAALNAAEFDADGAMAFASNALAGAAFERPGEIALALNFGKATYAGVEGRDVQAKLSFDRDGLKIEQASIADLNGAAVKASGRIDTSSASPRGAIALTIDAQRLEGAAKLASRWMPRAGDALQDVAARAPATRLNATLEVGASDAPGTDSKSAARLQIHGALGPVRLDISARGTGDLSALTDIDIQGRLTSDDGSTLARLIGIERYVTVEQRPVRLEFTSKGGLASGLRMEGKFTGAGVEASGVGSLRLPGDKPSGSFEVALSAADIPLLHREAAVPVPVNLRGRLGIDGERLTFEDTKGRIAGSVVTGRLGLELGRPLRVNGRLDVDNLEGGAVIGLGLGAPATGGQRSGVWLTEPFTTSPLADVEGRVAFSVRRAALTPTIMADQLRGAVVMERGALTLEGIEGRLGDGLLTGHASARSGPAGLALDGQFAVNGADLSQVLPASVRPNASGRMTLQVEAKGSGRSPAALIGDLAGGGTMTLENFQAAGLDPAAIGAAVRAVEHGVIIDAVRIGDIVRAALDRGRLNVPWAGGAFTISAGRVNLGTILAPARDGNIAASGSINLADETVDLRFDVTGAPRSDVLAGQRPEMKIALAGPIDAARRSVDVAPLVNWLTMRSVEQEARRLEAAEREAKRLEAVDREAKRLQAIENARRARAQELNEGSAPAAVGSVPSADRPPPLPPPIDIRPPPGASDRRTRGSAVVPPRVDGAPSTPMPFNYTRQ